MSFPTSTEIGTPVRARLIERLNQRARVLPTRRGAQFGSLPSVSEESPLPWTSHSMSSSLMNVMNDR